MEKLQPWRRTAAGRDEDGQSVRGGEAQAAARRQDGRPSRQQGRDHAHRADRRHAASGRRHRGGHGAQSAGRAVAHERGPDSWKPIWVGPAPVWAGRSATCSKGQARQQASKTLRRHLKTSMAPRTASEEIADLDDGEILELADNLRLGVPIATPVFDGAEEADIVDMLNKAGLHDLRPDDAVSTAVPASPSTVRSLSATSIC